MAHTQLTPDTIKEMQAQIDALLECEVDMDEMIKEAARTIGADVIGFATIVGTAYGKAEGLDVSKVHTEHDRLVFQTANKLAEWAETECNSWDYEETIKALVEEALAH